MADVITHKLGPWTFEDLQALPESAWRYEIVDGALVMSPSPSMRHQVIDRRLGALLNASIQPTRYAVGPISVNMHPTYRIPDLVVIDSALTHESLSLLQPSDVELAIEIVSPGSLTTDRITKPAQYAAVGIGAYWRVETAGKISITAYLLRPGDSVYTEVGTWGEGETMRLSEPFGIELEIAELAP